MSSTTLLRTRAQMRREPLPNCHDGEGALDWTVVIEEKDHPGAGVHFFHDNLMPPGASVGVHQHTREEHYYVLAGHGMMTLDGVRHPVGPGDLGVVYPGGSHGLENTGDEPLRFLVIEV